MIDSIIIPRDWRAALKAVQYLFPEAVLAGGALRDLFANRPAKDLDIFISSRGRDVFDVYEQLIELFGDARMVIGENLAEYSQALDEVAYAIETISDEGMPIQVIALKQPEVTVESAVERIDFGLCRISYDGKQLYVTPEFKRDLMLSCFTVCLTLSEARLKRTKERHERLQAKYPGWPLLFAN